MKASNVIVIDGSSTSRKLVANKIKQSRPEVVVHAYATVSSALPKFREQSYDLVAVGYTLPDGNGLDLASTIRNSPLNADTPIIMLSGNEKIDDSQIRQAYGVNASFDKSLGIEALIEYLESFLPKIDVPPKVLFIEDSKTAAMVLGRIFDRQNIPCTTLHSGAEAMKLIDEFKQELVKKYDVVITDLNLEGDVNGIDIIRHIRENLNLDKYNLPAFLVTASNEAELDYSGLRKLGVNDFANKPVDAEALLARIEPWVLVKRNYQQLEE